MPSRKPKLPAINQLRGVITVLDARATKPTTELLGTIREMVSDALAVLQEADPTTQRIAFVLLAIRQSTEVHVRQVRGKPITRVTIVDQSLYHWALAEIHAMAGAS
ncbi:hypothetical protein HF319_00680 [Xanthomonas sp. Kuri4-1]